MLRIVIALFAPVVIATAAGVGSVPADRVNAARALGASRRPVVTHVILPNALPAILTGLRLGLGVGGSRRVGPAKPLCRIAHIAPISGPQDRCTPPAGACGPS